MEIKNLQKKFQEIPEKILKFLKNFCITKKFLIPLQLTSRFKNAYLHLHDPPSLPLLAPRVHLSQLTEAIN